MKSMIESQKGITLIALVITIIVLLILSAVGIGEFTGNGNDLSQTKNTLALSELNKVQQIVLETEIKFKQLGNKTILKGEETTYAEANNILSSVGETAKGTSSPNALDDEKYYILTKSDLEELGMEKINNNDRYLVNYYTGEVFNITQKKTSQNEVLYVYAKTDMSE